MWKFLGFQCLEFANKLIGFFLLADYGKIVLKATINGCISQALALFCFVPSDFGP